MAESSLTVMIIVCSAVQPDTVEEKATTRTAFPLVIVPGVAVKVDTAEGGP